MIRRGYSTTIQLFIYSLEKVVFDIIYFKGHCKKFGKNLLYFDCNKLAVKLIPRNDVKQKKESVYCRFEKYHYVEEVTVMSSNMKILRRQRIDHHQFMGQLAHKDVKKCRNSNPQHFFSQLESLLEDITTINII